MSLILPDHIQRELDRDKLGSMDPEMIAAHTIKVLGAIQDWNPAVQAMSLGLAFVALVNSLGKDPRDFLDLLDRMNRDLQQQAAARAAQDYVDNEIRTGIQEEAAKSDLTKQVEKDISAMTVSTGKEEL